MANYCSKCGNEIEPEAKFCPSCGTKLQVQPPPKPAPSTSGGIFESLNIDESVNIKREDLVGHWQAKVSDMDGEDKRAGLLLLTKDDVIFVTKMWGVFSKKLKESWRVPLSQIKSVGKLRRSFSKDIYISYGSTLGPGFLKKIPTVAGWRAKIKDSESFIEKLKELNPNIK